VGLRSAVVSSFPDVRRGGIALSSVLLAAPILLVARPGAGVLLLAASFVGAVALLEGRRARTASQRREVTSPVSGLSRPLARSGQVCARWELVERDGQRSLVMRWR
jgi:hypothetical protein